MVSDLKVDCLRIGKRRFTAIDVLDSALSIHSNSVVGTNGMIIGGSSGFFAGNSYTDNFGRIRIEDSSLILRRNIFSGNNGFSNTVIEVADDASVEFIDNVVEDAFR